jgi:hypothetical protein
VVAESSSTRIVSWGFLRYVNEFLLAQAKPLLSLLIPLLHNLPTKSLFLFLLLSFPFFSSFDYNSLFFMLVCSSNNSLFFLFLSNVIFLFELNPFHQFFYWIVVFFAIFFSFNFKLHNLLFPDNFIIFFLDLFLSSLVWY